MFCTSKVDDCASAVFILKSMSVHRLFPKSFLKIFTGRFRVSASISYCSSSHMLGKYFLRCWPLTATGNFTPSNYSSMYALHFKTWSTLYGPCQFGDHLPYILS